MVNWDSCVLGLGRCESVFGDVTEANLRRFSCCHGCFSFLKLAWINPAVSEAIFSDCLSSCVSFSRHIDVVLLLQSR